MKNLKRMLGLLVVSVMAISVMGTARAEVCSGEACHVKATIVGSKKGSETATYGDLKDVAAEIAARAGVSDATEKITKVEITLLDDATLADVAFHTVNSATGGITCPVTINLGGHELAIDVASPFDVKKGGSLTINGSGEVTATDKATTLVSVDRSGSFKTTGKVTYTLDDTATFVATTTDESGRVTVTTDAGTTVEANVGFDVNAYADVTVAGTYNVADQLIKVEENASKANASVINVNAKATSTGEDVISVGGYTKLTINGGEYAADLANKNAVAVDEASAVVINGGDFKATSGSSEGKGYAVALGEDVEATINGGTFTSGEGSDGEYLPALFIKTMPKNKGNVIAGTFNYGMVATGKTLGEQGNPDTDKNIANLVATTSTYTVNKDNGTVVVKAGAASEPEKDPENKPSTGDDQPSENPKTFDAIGSLVTMAISSLGVVGTATKKMFK